MAGAGRGGLGGLTVSDLPKSSKAAGLAEIASRPLGAVVIDAVAWCPLVDGASTRSSRDRRSLMVAVSPGPISSR